MSFLDEQAVAMAADFVREESGQLLGGRLSPTEFAHALLSRLHENRLIEFAESPKDETP